MPTAEQHKYSPVRIQAAVVEASWKGQILAAVVETDKIPSSWPSQPAVGDKVVVLQKVINSSDINCQKGTSFSCKIVPNSNKRTLAVAKWFAPSAKPIRPSSTVQWEPWQDGEDSLVLQLPSTKPCSTHAGLVFVCWGCGAPVIAEDSIFQIRRSSVWSKTIDGQQLIVSESKEWNDVKKCFVQCVSCRSCKLLVGSYYAEEFEESETKQEFPCFKFITAWERRKWKNSKPSLALTLAGQREAVEQSIANLTPSDDWEKERPFLVGGRIDRKTYELMEKAKNAEAAEIEAEKAKKALADFEERVLLAEEAAAAAREETFQAEEKAKAVEKQLSKFASELALTDAASYVWECYVDQTWTEYPAEIAKTLEAHFIGKSKATFIWLDKSYSIDFACTRMMQENTQTKYRRPVRRQEGKPKVVWECNVEQVWVAYPSEISEYLEVTAQHKDIASFQLAGGNYEIDFSQTQPEQMNVDTGYKRPIRRSMGSMVRSSPTRSVPASWTIQAGGNECVFVPLDTTTTEWKAVEREFHKTMPAFRLIKMIERVENPSLWEYFSFRQERVTKLTGNANIQHVWHGTRSVDPKIICSDQNDGFMTQCSQQGMWGRGTYFAADASYSSNYAYTGWGAKTIILARLVIGDAVKLCADSSLTQCPDKPDGKRRYDTVTGTTQGSKVFIVYENGRAYPEYLVRY